MFAFAPSASPAGAWAHSFRVCARLVWNDCKQGLRKHLAGTTRRDRLLRAGGALFGVAFMAGLHFAAFALFSYTWLSPSENKADLIAGLSASVWAFLLFVMLSEEELRAIDSVAPEGAIAGSRYAEEQMRMLDSERRPG